jgi:hypothetical protein
MRLTRREFIVSGVAAGATISLPSWSRKVRFAVIGVGQSGLYQLTAGDLPDVLITSICDTNPGALNLALHMWKVISGRPIQVFSDYRYILDDPAVDAVVCAVPLPSRRRVTIDSLSAGKHVYCVPPFASSFEEGRELINCAKEAHRVLWQGSIDPIWDVACLARAVKSALRGSGATLKLTRRLGMQVYSPHRWFQGLDLVSRLTEALPLQTISMVSPVSDFSRLDVKLGDSPPLSHIAIATQVEGNSREEWDISLRSGNVCAQIWAGVVESKNHVSERPRTVSSWHEFLHVLLQGTSDTREEHHSRMLRSLLWTDTWSKHISE